MRSTVVSLAVIAPALLLVHCGGDGFGGAEADPDASIVARDGGAKGDAASGSSDGSAARDARADAQDSPDATKDATVGADASSDATTQTDGSPPADAGPDGAPEDAAPPVADSALPPEDADPPVDAALPPEDAEPPVDAALPPEDTSPPPVDANPPPPDMDRPPSCGQTVPALKLTEVPLPGVSFPVMAAFPPSDPTRVMVVQLAGVIRLLKNGALTTFLDLSSVVRIDGERGLLGFAFHPNYAQNGRFFVYYALKSNGDAMLQEYVRSAADPDKADPTPVATLIQTAHPQDHHYAGMLAFGPDGYLYVASGDGFINTNGQSLTTRFGKILRVDVDTRAAPPGNMTGAGVEPLIWDWGLRNPWRFSFDRKTGDIYIGDVGEGNYEEIDFEAAHTGHLNFGWATMEGMHCQFSATCNQTGLTLPIVEHKHPDSESIIGGYVYRGKNIPCLRGRYLYGDYDTQKVWTFTYEGGVLSAQKELTSDLNPTFAVTLTPTSFFEDPDGELYFVTLTGNKMYRIDPE